MSPAREGALKKSLDLLARLHRPKDAMYGNAWRKRGEVLSIFCNIARKYDRLVVGLSPAEGPSEIESIADTAADLCIYAGKYLTWLAEVHPDAFDQIPPAPPSARCRADLGTPALDEVFQSLLQWEEGREEPGTLDECWADVIRSFEDLERCLMALAAGGHELPTTRVSLAWNLVRGSAWLFVRIGRNWPSQIEAIERAVRAAGTPL